MKITPCRNREQAYSLNPRVSTVELSWADADADADANADAEIIHWRSSSHFGMSKISAKSGGSLNFGQFLRNQSNRLA